MLFDDSRAAMLSLSRRFQNDPRVRYGSARDSVTGLEVGKMWRVGEGIEGRIWLDVTKDGQLCSRW